MAKIDSNCYDVDVSSTTENYLKRILAETQRTGDRTVTLGRVAELSDVTPGTVTTMMKNLADADLVEYLPRQGVRLTQLGIKDATQMLRRHRLVELFLVEILGFDWSDVHSEAEVLEHAVSDRVIDRIDEFLGNPTSDPHGDPIPTATGKLARASARLLSDLSTPGVYTISRISNDEPRFLDFLKGKHLTPGQNIYVVERDAIAQTIDIRANDIDVTLSLAVAGRIFVTGRGKRSAVDS